ncbi:MAG: PHP domain-containing protein [Defluviitaleaceae bacterium]|nr:PHP domain-containing protein [Defluviitaleaceae bacterium]
MKPIDLHTHSIYSDGTLSPGEIVARAKTKGLAAISITDHDTVQGLSEGESAAAAAGIEFLHGCEISAYHGNWQVHILGYCIDPRSQTLAAQFEELAAIRDERNRKMLDALGRIGIDVSHDQLSYAAGCNIITRSHFARVLWNRGYARSIQDAFDKYVSQGAAAYVPHEAMTTRDCIEFIRREGGVPVLAHPFQYHTDDSRTGKLVEELAGYGLMGIESIYTSHTLSQTLQAKRWANKYRLVETGGSDFHGENRPAADLGVGRGSLFVPYSIIENLRQAKSGVL